MALTSTTRAQRQKIGDAANRATAAIDTALQAMHEFDARIGALAEPERTALVAARKNIRERQSAVMRLPRKDEVMA